MKLNEFIKMKKFLFLAVLLCLMSCTRSLVYSPSVMLSPETLKAKEFHLNGSLELFPETRPKKIKDHTTSLGLTSSITVGVKDNLSLRLKGWADVQGRQSAIRSGFALSAFFSKEISESSSLLFVPSVGIAIDGGWFGGVGLGNSVIYQKNISSKVNLYGGLGLVWGIEQLEKKEDPFGEERLPSGTVLTANFGVGIAITEQSYLNFELNPLYQLNNFDNESDFIVAPSIGIGFGFNRSKLEIDEVIGNR